MALVRKRSSGIERSQARAAYIFLIPVMLLFLVLAIIPMFAALYLSFTRYNVFRPAQWIGWENYRSLLEEEIFIQSIKNTIYYVVGTVPASMIIALALALLLNRKIRGRIVYRTIYFLPTIISMVAVSMIWMWLFNSQSGLLNKYIVKLGIAPQDWLGDPRLAMPSIIVMSIWKGLGYNVVIYLAGLQGIPEYLYEAATIDGANEWGYFRHITLPLLKPTTLFILVISCIGAFQVFEQIYIMTQGGPINSTTTMVHQIYQHAFQFLEMGYASAMSFILFGAILILSLINMRVLGSDAEYL